MNRLRHSVEVNVPVEELFAYYADVRKVPRLTPSDLHLRLLKAETPMHHGSRVLFAVRPRMVPFEVHWLLKITELTPNKSFTEELVKGPFTYWRHHHEFEALDEGRSRVVDTIEFGRPTGIVRHLLSQGRIRSMLRRAFRHREEVLHNDLEAL